MFVLGSARLDREKRLLITGSGTVALQRKPFLVLLYLIENRHRMILRQELIDQFWDGKDVYDQSLSKAVGSIRKAFGETRDSSIFIETRWGIGYRYVGPFDETAPSETPRPPRPTPSDAAPALPDPVPPASRNTSIRWLSVLLLTGFLAAIAFFILRTRSHHSFASNAVHASVLEPIRSVAVLPFSADSGQQQDQYLGLGVADAVADKLSTTNQLNVRSSSTVLAILGPHPDPTAAGSRLKVQAIVTGDLHRTPRGLGISVRLIDSTTHSILWSGSSNADDSNIFSTESSIAQLVSNALLPQLGANPIQPSTAPDTTHPEAYSDYMKAEFFAGSRTQGSFLKAINLLNHAILIDPNYARAYAALASCYQLQGFYHLAPPEQAYPRAKSAALKALSLDNSLAEAHVALLSIYTDYDWDWDGATREFKATIAIDPNYAVAYQYYGYALFGMGRGEEGLAAMKHAAELDPVSPSVQTSLAWAYFLLRQFDQSVDQCQRVLELYPDFVPAHQLRGLVLGLMKRDQKSLAELTLARKLEPDSSITPILIDYELASSGRRAEAAAHLNSFFVDAHGGSIPDYYLAAAWVAVGDKRQAQLFLNRALQAHSNWIIYLQYDPRFDDLRTNPQFQSLIRHVTNSHVAPSNSGVQAQGT
jgi:TolB-like protein/DNA-binding winged helix-turn-helix (wHTH) protein/tetratricopeptide (TPR) repeat protein